MNRHRPGLLVSVRSAEEARAALEGGASVIDVKEPDRGPLGRADLSIWGEVTRVVAGRRPVSAALGELSDLDPAAPIDSLGLDLLKLGLAGSGGDWLGRWDAIRRRAAGARWIAVIYSDHDRAGSPDPDAVIDAALALDECVGVLIDTFDKSRRSTVDESWRPRIERVQASGRSLALAGGLDRAAMARLAPLRPDLFAARGAACDGGSRVGRIRADLVRALVDDLERGSG